jgi:hypothetical protein
VYKIEVESRSTRTVNQTFPDSEHQLEKRDLFVKNFVIVTPTHPEVPSRNWSIHDPKDMEKCGDLDPPTFKKTSYFEVCFLTLDTLIK